MSIFARFRDKKPLAPMMKNAKAPILCAVSCLGIMSTIPHAALAQQTPYSSMVTGPLGLNTVPSARMDETGTMRAGLSTLDPYVHGFIGFQLADPLYINLRQSAEVSNLNGDADRLYPGVDFKLRLLTETRA